jgi:hypothetical protein
LQKSHRRNRTANHASEVTARNSPNFKADVG